MLRDTDRCWTGLGSMWRFYFRYGTFMISTAFTWKILVCSPCFWGRNLGQILHWMCGWISERNVFPFCVRCMCMCVHMRWFHASTKHSRAAAWWAHTRWKPQLLWLCVLYKDFITQCFRQLFTLPGESKCQWHPSPAQMSSANKQGVSLAVLPLPADSLCQRQTTKCHLFADSCLCRAHSDTRRESPPITPHPSLCTATTLSAHSQTCSLPVSHPALTALHCISK